MADQDYEATFRVGCSKEQLADIRKMLGSAVEVESRNGPSDYYLGLLWAERSDDLVTWCDEHQVAYELV